MTENYTEFCFNRLPCGLCRLTNQFCPLASNNVEITCQNYLQNFDVCSISGNSLKHRVEEVAK